MDVSLLPVVEACVVVAVPGRVGIILNLEYMLRAGKSQVLVASASVHRGFDGDAEDPARRAGRRRAWRRRDIRGFRRGHPRGCPVFRAMVCAVTYSR